jgi:hypothetical protein
MADTSSLSDYLAELGVDVNNMQEFLLKLSVSLSAKSDTVKVTQTLQDGSTKDFQIPSFGYLTTQVQNLDQKFTDLLSGNANQLGIKDASGTLKTFELKDISTVIADLENVSSTGVAVPDSFNYKTNWFFESFLNPLLYINIDTSTITTDTDINRFEVRRLIITSATQTELDYFDSTYKGKNNLAYSTVTADLANRAIDYFEDGSELTLSPAKNTVRGSFDILDVLESSSTVIVEGQTLTEAIRKYKLNTLKYSGLTTSGTVEKSLVSGDRLISSDNSEYIIDTIDSNAKTVILKLVFGENGLAVGSAQLRIKPALERSTLVQLNLGYNERNIIFLRPISDRLAITTDQFSQGFAIQTNELTITMNNGKQMTLTDFYQEFVSDFGLLFLSYAKEKKLPSSLGSTPNTVALSADNFKVIQIDQHITDEDNTLAIKQKISAKEQAVSQIREIDKQITETRANLNTNASLNESQKLKLQKDLATFADNRLTLTKSQQSLVSDITTSIKSTPSFITNPTYRVRGFWSIPESKTTLHGTQQVVQFKIAYRTLSKTGTAKTADQIEFIDANGNKVSGAFSPWTEFKTKSRSKIINTATGFYEWANESIADPNEVNSNQLDVPIKRGEVVEIRIKSLSEAGWPDSPVESAWSDSILVEFPANIETAEDATIVSQQAFAEETRINFQDELNSKGLDIHLGTSFTTRDKYFAHKAEDIASGFFATDGNVVDLYTKLKSIADTLTSVQTSLSTGKGQLNVTIIDQAGNTKTVTNGQTVELFAGYYKDLIKDTSVTPIAYNHGKIISTQYLVQIQNTSQTALQLISTLNGGVGQTAPTSDAIANPTVIYHTGLRYDKTPIVINNQIDSTISDWKQKDSYQSSQVRSQFINSRYYSVNLADRLYFGDSTDNVPYTNATSGNYQYNGRTVGATTVPYVYGHYLPFNPLLTTIPGYSSPSNTSVWNGTLDANLAPVGGGKLSEFCIDKNHPFIKVGGAFNQAWDNTTYTTARPAYSLSDTKQKYLPFSHGINFEIAESEVTNAFGNKYYQQAPFNQATAVTVGTASSAMRENQYPVKLGFIPEDQYLIGKYTCGAYLYMAPSAYENISVEGISPAGSTRSLEYGVETAIKIPLIFQFRASDYIGYVGGWRSATPAGLKNIKYAKKIGLDLYTSDSVFSFDVLVKTQYEKETAVVTPVSQLEINLAGISASA